MLNHCSVIPLQARADAKLVGVRAKRIKDAAENPDDISKVKK